MQFRLARHNSRSSCWGSRSIWTVMQHVPLSGPLLLGPQLGRLLRLSSARNE